MVLLCSVIALVLFLVFDTSAYAATTTRDSANGTSCVQRYVNENGNSVTEHYRCPEYDEPSEKTLCCDKQTQRCCLAPKASRFSDFELPQHMAIIISVAVVLAAAVFTGVMIACCCWEKCPLYMACRAEAKPDYIAKPDDVAGLSLMPDDNMEEAKIYEPGKASSKSAY